MKNREITVYDISQSPKKYHNTMFEGDLENNDTEPIVQDANHSSAVNIRNQESWIGKTKVQTWLTIVFQSD